MKVPMSLFYDEKSDEPRRVFRLTASGGSVADINVEELVYLLGCDEYNTQCRAWCELDPKTIEAQPAQLRELMTREPRFLIIHYNWDRDICWSATFRQDGSLIIMSNDDHAARFVLRSFVRGDSRLGDTWQYSGQWIEDKAEIAAFLGQTHAFVASEGFGEVPEEAVDALRKAGEHFILGEPWPAVKNSLECVSLVLDSLFQSMDAAPPRAVRKKLGALIDQGVLPRYIEAAVLGTARLSQRAAQEPGWEPAGHEAEMAT